MIYGKNDAGPRSVDKAIVTNELIDPCKIERELEYTRAKCANELTSDKIKREIATSSASAAFLQEERPT